MIYELRTYTFHNGRLPAYIQHVEKVGRPVRGDDYGKCHGYWTAEFGQLNQAWHLWSYASLDERTRMREALSKNERWTREYVPVVQPMLQRQDIRFLNPVVDIKPPATGGGVYELRIYRHAARQGRTMGAAVQVGVPGARKVFAERLPVDRRGAAA